MRRNAKWLGQWVARECGVMVPVGQVVAIPGWSVEEKKLTSPRVVTGRGVADAVRWALKDGEQRGGVKLTTTQREKIRDLIEARCREG